MNASFDPYHKWLGIPPEEQPPHDYRLLGVRPFESDREVIENAADRQAMLLRTVQIGKHHAESQRLMNEVASARLRLLNPEKKAAYDQQLRLRLAAMAPAQTSAPPLPVARPLSAAELAGFTPAARSAPGPVTAPSLPPPADQPFPAPAEIGFKTTPASDAAPGRNAKIHKRPPWIPIAAAVTVIALLAGGGGAYVLTSRGGAAPQELSPPAENPPAPPATAGPVDPAGSDASDSLELDGGPKVAISVSATSSRDSSQVATDAGSDPGTAPPQGAAPGDRPPVRSSPATNPSGVSPPSPPSSPGVSVAAGNAASSAPASSGPAAVDVGAAEPEKLAPPDDADLDKAREEVREIFASQYEGAQTPQQQLELAKTLFEQAEQVQDDPRGRYALLIEAFEQTVAAGHYQSSLKVVDTLDAEWEVDRLRLLGRALVSAVRSPHAAAMRPDLIGAALAVAEEAIAARRYDGADSMAAIADGLAAKERDIELRKKCRELLDRTRRLKREWERVAAAQKTLAEDPEDADANLAVGKHLCLSEGHFAEGLPLLVKGSEPALQSLAKRDLEEQDRKPEERAEARVELADAWNELAASSGDLAGFFVRAHHWYSQAAPHATGLLKTKADRRLAELAEHEAVQKWLDDSQAKSAAAPTGPIDIQLTPLTTLIGHTDQVRRVAFAPQGRILATGSDDNTVRIWDLDKKTPFLTALTGHTNDVPALAWTPDGKSLATGSEDKTIQIWDLAKGRRLRAMQAPGSMGVSDLAFAPNGRVLISCGMYNAPAVLWDARTGAAGGAVPPTHRYVYDVEFTADGRPITAGSDSNAAIVWDAAGKPAFTFSSPYSIRFATPSPDGKHLLVGSSSSSSTHVYSLADGSTVASLSPAYGMCGAWSPDGRVLAIGGSSSIQLFDASTWELRSTRSVRSVVSISFSADGKLLATCGGDHIVSLWNVETSPRQAGAPVPASPPQFSNPPAPQASVTITAPGAASARTPPPPPPGIPNGPTGLNIRQGATNTPVVRGAKGEMMRLIATMQTGPATGAAESTTAMSFTPDGAWLITGDSKGQIRFWDGRTGAPTARIWANHSGDVTAVAVDSRGSLAASGDSRGVVTYRRVHLGTFLGRVTDEGPPVTSLAFTPDDRLLIGRQDGAIQLVRPQDRVVVREFRRHQGAVAGVASSADGGTLFSAGVDGRVLAGPMADAQQSTSDVLQQPTSIAAANFSRAGDLIAVINAADSRLLVNRTADGRSAWSLSFSNLEFRHAAFSGDGGVVAIGSTRGHVQVRELQGVWLSGRPFNDAGIQALALSPDASRLALATDKGDLWLWEIVLPEKSPAAPAPQTGAAASPSPASPAAAGGPTEFRGAGGERARRLATLAPRAANPPSDPPISAMAFSADGDLLITGETSGQIKLWSARDGATFFAESPHGMITICDAATSKTRLQPRVFSSDMNCLAISPDGSRLAAASVEGELALWEVALPPLNAGTDSSQ